MNQFKNINFLNIKLIKYCILILILSTLSISCTYSHTVSVYLSPELKTFYGYYPSLEVDIVGLNDSEKNWIDSYDINKYFEIDNPLRKTLSPVTMKFSEEDKSMQYLGYYSKYWNKWKKKGAKELYIIVNLPQVESNGSEDKSQKSKPNILTFKIKSNIFKWHKKYIEIKPAGVLLLPNAPEGDYGAGRNIDEIQ